MFILSLFFGISFQTLGDEKKDTFEHPIQKRQFKRAGISSKLTAFKVQSLNAYDKKKNLLNLKPVFINWQQLYWGKLRDLIYSDSEAYAEDIGETQEGDEIQIEDTESCQEFTAELRKELKAFAKHFNFKIMWRKTLVSKIPDVTSDFLDYWGKGLSKNKGNFHAKGEGQ
jgi:hypothetical protein